jgi:hypothetical protein
MGAFQASPNTGRCGHALAPHQHLVKTLRAIGVAGLSLDLGTSGEPLGGPAQYFRRTLPFQ